MFYKIFYLFILFSITLQLCAENFVLARNNKAESIIIIPQKPNEKLLLAAKDLQSYVKKICGVELKIINSNKKINHKAIYIWPNSFMPLKDRLQKNDPPDGYVIKLQDKNIFIYGRTNTAVTYGVYSMLQESFNIRWFAPSEDWEYVPKSPKQGDLTIKIENKKYFPSITPRLWAGHYYTAQLKDWCRRQRVATNEIKFKGSFANNIYRVFPPQKYGKTHPQYYPLVNGKRYIPAPNEVKWRPCESNKEVQQILINYIRNYFDKNPYIDSFSLGLDDVFHVCHCPYCIAMDNKPDDIAKKRFSSRHYKFVNIIAKEIAKTHPNRYIGTLIYSPTLQPPVDVPHMEKNTFGFITQNSAQWKSDDIKKANMVLTEEWSKRIPYLSRYEYIGLSCITPRYYPHLLNDAFRYDLKHNFQGMYQEVCTFLPLTAPMVWALSELQWDSRKNIDTLLNEYMTKIYGDAATEMTLFFNHLEDSWMKSPGKLWVYNDLIAQCQVMTLKQLKQAYAILDKAYHKTKYQIIKKRIQVTKDSLQYGGYLIEQYTMAKEAEKMKLKTTKDAVKILDTAVKFAYLAAERESFWNKSMKAATIFGESLRGQSKRGNLVSNGQISTLEAIMVSAATNALKKLEKSDTKVYQAQYKRLNNLPASAFIKTVIASNLPAEYKSKNLLQNPSFEKSKPNGEPLFWVAWGAVPDKFPVAKKMGRNNTDAAKVRYNVGVAYLQYRKVTPGEQFYAQVWIKGSGTGKGTLAFRFKTADGKWYPNRELEPRINQNFDNTWRKIELFCTVPPGAAIMQFSVGGYRIGDGSYVLLDDAVLQKVDMKKFSEKQ